MEKRIWKILLVEDDEDDFVLARDYLLEAKGRQFELKWVATIEAALEHLENKDIILVDYDLGVRNGLELIRDAVARGCKAPIILLSGRGSYEVDVEAMQAGATDYLSKNELTPAILERSIRYSIERKRIEEALLESQQELEKRVRERTEELWKANQKLHTEIAEHKQAEEQIQRNAIRNVALADLSRTLAEAGQDYQKVLDIVVRQIVELLGDNCTITLLTGDGRFVEPVAFFHPDPTAQTFLQQIHSTTRYRVGEGFAGQVAKTGQPVLVPVVAQERVLAAVKPEYRPYVERFGMHSILIVPLRVQAKVIGTLGVTRDQPGRPYVAEDQAFLQDLADRAALAITNTHLFEMVQKELAERQRVDAALRSSNALFEGLFDSAPDAILLAALDGRILRVNRKVQDKFGYHLSELIGQKLESLLPFPVEEQHLAERVSNPPDLLGGLIGLDLDLSAVRKDQSEFPVYVTLSPLLLEGETYVICIVHDITARKQIEDALRKSEARFRTIFEEAAIGIKLIGLDGRIIACNPAMEEMLGYCSDEITGLTYTDIIDPADAVISEELFFKLANGMTDRYRLEKRFRHKDGFSIWVRQLVSLVRDENGAPQFAMAMVENISERKRMEAELAEVQRRLMDSREAERIHLSQELHDGPMQTLYGLSYQMKSIQDEMMDHPSAARLGEMQETIKQIVQILRITCGELRPPTLAPFGLEKTIRSHAEQFQRDHPEIAINLALASDRLTLPENIRLSLFRIYQQALANVIRHAQAKKVTVHFAMDQDEVVLEVTDDGRGFSVPKSWIDFAREGHLGLAGIAERAEIIRGKLLVDSEPGKGTSLRVSVPWRQAVPVQPEIA